MADVVSYISLQAASASKVSNTIFQLLGSTSSCGALHNIRKECIISGQSGMFNGPG